MAEILTPCCPLCGDPPMMVFGGGTQAFCGNDDGCPVLTWDPTRTADEFLRDARRVQWQPAEGEGEDGDPPLRGA